MDIKKEYKNHLFARKIISIISIVIWSGIIFYIFYKFITTGFQNISSIYWAIVGVSIFFITFEIFYLRTCKKKIKELE